MSGLSPSRPFLSLQLIVTDFSSLRCSLLCVYLFIISSLMVSHWRLKMTKALSVWSLKNFCPNALSWLKDHKARRRQSVFHCCVLLAHLSPAPLTLSPCGTWPAVPPAIQFLFGKGCAEDNNLCKLVEVKTLTSTSLLMSPHISWRSLPWFMSLLCPRWLLLSFADLHCFICWSKSAFFFFFAYSHSLWTISIILHGQLYSTPCIMTMEAYLPNIIACHSHRTFDFEKYLDCYSEIFLKTSFFVIKK